MVQCVQHGCMHSRGCMVDTLAAPLHRSAPIHPQGVLLPWARMPRGPMLRSAPGEWKGTRTPFGVPCWAYLVGRMAAIGFVMAILLSCGGTWAGSA